MVAKPQNHVTRAQLAVKNGLEVKLPLLDRDSIEALEALFPPRCLRPNEMVEDHLRYAGAVELIGSLRARFDAHHKADDEEDDGEEPDLQGAERAP